MATQVQKATGTLNGTGTATLTLPSAVTAGNLIVVAITQYDQFNPVTFSVTDNRNGATTYTQACYLNKVITASESEAVGIYYFENTAGSTGSNSFTVSIVFTHGTGPSQCSVMEVSGCKTSGALDRSTTNFGLSSSSSATATMGAANQASGGYAVACLALYGTDSASAITCSGYANDGVQNNGSTSNPSSNDHKILSAPETTSVTYSHSHTGQLGWVVALATFQDAVFVPLAYNIEDAWAHDDEVEDDWIRETTLQYALIDGYINISEDWTDHDQSIEDFEWLSLEYSVVGDSGSPAVPPEDPWQFENDIEDFDWSTLDPGTVTANATQLGSLVYSEEWDDLDAGYDPVYSPMGYLQLDKPPQPPEDAWPHDDFTEEEWLLTVDENRGVGFPAAVLAFINHEADFTQDDYVEDFFADHFSNEDVGLCLEDPWSFDADWIEDEWWVEDAVRINANLLARTETEIWWEDEPSEDFFTNHYTAEDAYPYTIEDGWTWDDDTSDDWWVDENIGPSAAAQPALASSDIDWQEEVDDELVLDAFINADQPQPMDEGWWQDDVTDDEWLVEPPLSADLSVTPAYDDEVALLEEFVTDDWVDDTNTGDGVLAYAIDDGWTWDEFAEDDWYVDDYVGITFVVVLLPYVIEDGWVPDEHAEDDWWIDENIGPNLVVLPQFPAYNEVGFEFLADYEVEDFFTNHYTAEETYQPVEDGWVWDDDTADEWFVEDNITVAPYTSRDAWSHDDTVEDEWYLDEALGASSAVTSVYEEWWEEYADDDWYADDVQNIPLLPRNHHKDHEWCEEDIDDEWWTDETLVTPQLVSFVSEDAWMHDDDTEDDWSWWLDEKLSISLPPSPIQHFGDEASYLEEWLQIDDDSDWYNISNLVVDAAKSSICILQAQDTIRVLQDMDSIRIIGGN